MLHYVIRPYDNLVLSLGSIYTCTKVKVILHGTKNDKFKRITALQRWNNVATICINVT